MAAVSQGKEIEREAAPSMFGAVERLLGAAAVLGAALYVLVNGLYIEFYDDFGVRPEQVGFDRLAVLARSAWIALIAIAVAGPVVVFLTRRAEKRGSRELDAEFAKFRDDQPKSEETVEQAVLWDRVAETKRQLQRVRWLGAMALVTSVLFLVTFWALAYQVDAEADRVAQGQSSNGIGWLVPFIDVRANRAEVAWVDQGKMPPPGLVDSPFLMYLGSGAGVTVLVDCGERTHIVQSSDVVVTLLDQGTASTEDMDQKAAFKGACG